MKGLREMKKLILLIQVTLFFLTLTEAYSQSGWFSQNSGTTYNLHGVFFTDANTGNAVGDNGTILRTTDGGTNWTMQLSGITSWRGVYFVNANTGSAVGWDYTSESSGVSVIKRTTNGGNNWFHQSCPIINILISSVSFTDANTGTAVGEGGNIFRTTNGGANWISQISGTTYDLSDVSFADANTGTVVGGYFSWNYRDFHGIILRTTNGGTNWILQYDGTGYELESVSFADANTGTVVGWEGTILRTTNGGTNWIQQSSGTTNDLYGVSFTNANTGTVVGGDYGIGTILRTTNGGTNWTSQISGTNAFLLSVFFTNANTGTVVGFYGTILRTTNGGFTFINQISSEIPEGFSLYQNYPNPFNPFTNISFDIQNSNHVRIIIYNALGEEVVTLVNEKLSAGSYEVNWDASGNPSGVYFYKLQAGDYKETKKMMLIK